MRMAELGDGGQDKRATTVPSQMSVDSNDTSFSNGGEVPTNSILVTNMDQAIFCERETMVRIKKYSLTRN